MQQTEVNSVSWYETEQTTSITPVREYEPESSGSESNSVFGVASLSAVQRAYRQEPSQYLAMLHARAESLFEQGYRVRPGRMPGVFYVLPEDTKRAKRNGSPEGYLVHAVRLTCSCPFFAKQEQGEVLDEEGSYVHCKHLLGLEKLIKLTAAEHKANGEMYCYYRLIAQWWDVLAERHRSVTETSGLAAGNLSLTGRIACTVASSPHNGKDGHSHG
jgi:hypothetical protein